MHCWNSGFIIKAACYLLFTVIILTSVESDESFQDPFFGRRWNFDAFIKKKAKEFGFKQNTRFFPGTKWCGFGHRAKHRYDFGRLKSLDKCCRDHDKCKGDIQIGRTLHGYTNRLNQVLMPCQCDKSFARCLKKGNTLHKITFGFVLFRIKKLRCYIVKRRFWSRRKYLQISRTKFSVPWRKQIALLLRG